MTLASSLEVPQWAAQPTVYVALRPYEPAFRFRGVSICTSRGEEYPVESYREVVREFSVEHSHAKHSALASGDTYMVGSLARLKLWSHLLTGRAVDAFDTLFPQGVVDNVMLNNWAQLVELVHCLERGIEVCDELLAMPTAESELIPYEVRAGRGVGAIEVPRGTLFHEYEIDDDGRVVSANVITPTAQNLANTERDLRVAVERLLEHGGFDDAALKLNLEMVARAYDPCISCSVHVVRDLVLSSCRTPRSWSASATPWRAMTASVRWWRDSWPHSIFHRTRVWSRPVPTPSSWPACGGASFRCGWSTRSSAAPPRGPSIGWITTRSSPLPSATPRFTT